MLSGCLKRFRWRLSSERGRDGWCWRGFSAPRQGHHVVVVTARRNFKVLKSAGLLNGQAWAKVGLEWHTLFSLFCSHSFIPVSFPFMRLLDNTWRKWTRKRLFLHLIFIFRRLMLPLSFYPRPRLVFSMCAIVAVGRHPSGRLSFWSHEMNPNPHFWPWRHPTRSPFPHCNGILLGVGSG